MAFITFVTPYRPIICGIADYAQFVTRESPRGAWDVLSFNLGNYGVPLSNDRGPLTDPVWYSIPSRDDYSARHILEGLRPRPDQVLWFQHEFGVWRSNSRFASMLRDLNNAKVITLHSLHFQSSETEYGLRGQEYSLLQRLLPYTDAITVFSDGVYKAVTGAFPEYGYKVHVLRHGTHVYNKVAGMTRQEAKAMIHEYLESDSTLDQARKHNLRQQRILLDPNAVVIGGAGFVTANKGIELLYHVRDVLQQMLPESNIAAIYVGFLREPDNSVDGSRAAELKSRYDGAGKFFLDTYLPAAMLPVMLRALDVYFYWPSDCTQSGIMAHALGAGATIACRDMEGVGETVRMAGGLTSADLGQLVAGIKRLVLHPEIREEMSKSALRYANVFSWRNQALKHYELAEQLCRSRFQVLTPILPLSNDSHTDSREPSIV